MNLVFSENTGEYLNKTSKNIVPASNKQQINELDVNSEKAKIINAEED